MIPSRSGRGHACQQPHGTRRFPGGPPVHLVPPARRRQFAVGDGFPAGTAIGADGGVWPSQLPGGWVAGTVYIGHMTRWTPVRALADKPPGAAANSSGNRAHRRYRHGRV